MIPPQGLASWIVEKFYEWSDCNGDIESQFTKDDVAHEHHDLLGYRDNRVRRSSHTTTS